MFLLLDEIVSTKQVQPADHNSIWDSATSRNILSNHCCTVSNRRVSWYVATKQKLALSLLIAGWLVVEAVEQ